MEKKRKSGTAYLMQLAGKYKLHLFVSALFGIASALCSFVPYVMVYRSILVLLDGEGNALRYGLIAAAAIAGKFLCSIVSGTFSHIGAFNTLYNVRTQISRHIAKVNLGFFTDHASGEIKKVIIEDVERIERFLAHQIPDVTSAICAPVIVFIYLLTINVPMALCLLVPVVLGLIIQGVAMAITGKQMPTYHRLLEKLNTAIMQFINGMPVMKAYVQHNDYDDYRADRRRLYNAKIDLVRRHSRTAVSHAGDPFFHKLYASTVSRCRYFGAATPFSRRSYSQPESWVFQQEQHWPPHEYADYGYY